MPAKRVGSHVFGREIALGRTLNVSSDPILDEESAPSTRQDLLLALYGEVCSNWRALVDVRFKLLALVPAVSALLLSTLLSRKPASEGLTDAAGVVIGLFGFIVTLALFVYDQRNSQLHDELISRGRRIEKELGLAVGQFLGRPGSWSFVKHDFALIVVYGATSLAWLAAVVVFLTST